MPGVPFLPRFSFGEPFRREQLAELGAAAQFRVQQAADPRTMIGEQAAHPLPTATPSIPPYRHTPPFPCAGWKSNASTPPRRGPDPVLQPDPDSDRRGPPAPRPAVRRRRALPWQEGGRSPGPERSGAGPPSET